MAVPRQAEVAARRTGERAGGGGRRFGLLLAVAAVVWGLCGPAGAVSKEDKPPKDGKDKKEHKEATQARKLRFLPVGDMPPFRQEVRDGVRYELEPPPGSIPPREVQFDGRDGESVTTRLLLGQTTSPLEVPGDAEQLVVRTVDGKPWLTLDLKVPGNMLVVMWREASATWEKPRGLLLPEESFATGLVRLVNTTSVVINLTVAGKDQAVGPGKIAYYRAGVTQNLPMQLAWQASDGSWRPFYSSALTMNPGERGQVILYRGDPAPGRPPVKVVFLREKTPPPPEKEHATRNPAPVP